MTIHREGHRLLLVSGAILFALNAGARYFFQDTAWVPQVVLGISAVFFLLLLQFFRLPKVKTEINPNHIIAPADGKVVVIEEVHETEYFDGPRKQISIFMSPINVHVNRNPMSGIVKYVKYHAGKYLVAWHPKSSTENERTTIVVKNEQGVEVLMRQIAGALAKRIRWYIQEGQQVLQGGEFGFIKFGSRVDVLLPLDAEVTVNLNEKTKGGKTIIAKLK
ncbi:phosphatidylserine decarboxylase family protein [Rapidithrix thailandica]|uniref:Phosphatidylserine decarboxylase proenzyme n=1 Tax=Rapidithrix thailandica TaxID=413964 RepID=A0AAW9SCX9_9BACT